MIKRKVLVYTFLLLVLLVFLVLPRTIGRKSRRNEVCFKNCCFYVELARTQQEMARGLMYRKSLDLDKGMLFVFEEERESSFWMKNTLIALDIIWISEDKEAVFVRENVQPCVEESCRGISPGKEAKYVLELNAGTVDRIGLKTGDRLNFSID